jgi:hypothetical protein
MSVMMLTSCGRYTTLTKDNYEVMLRDNNLQNVSFKCEKEIPLKMVNPDTIISTVNKRGVCKFDHIKREVYSIPKDQKIVIVQCYNSNIFRIEFVDYDLQFYMMPYGKEFIIRKDFNGSIYGTNYRTSIDNPKIKFKMRKSKSTQLIDLQR